MVHGLLAIRLEEKKSNNGSYGSVITGNVSFVAGSQLPKASTMMMSQLSVRSSYR
jgi:hypothetical protein